jgi:hypothetical protein
MVEMFDDFFKELKFLEKNKNFLGKEFLSWIWLKLHVQNHSLSIPNYGTFKMYMDDRIVLSSKKGSVHEFSLKGGTPAYADEMKNALKSGKLIAEAKFILEDKQRQWSFAITGESLTLKNVKLPKITSSSEEPSHYLSERIMLTDVLVHVIDSLYKDFMKIRISETNFLENVEDMKGEIELN